MAADLALGGHSVILYEHPDFAEGLGPVREEGRIRLDGDGETATAELASVTTDAAEALEAAEVLHLVIAANGHETFFREMLPHLRDDHTVVIWAGDYGSLRLRALLSEARPDLDVAIYETHTLPYGARLEEPGRVSLLLSAPEVLIAALPATDTDRTIELLGAAFPCLRTATNVLEVALNNPNPIVHPAGALLNTGRIQSDDDFHLYRDGITEAVARVIRGVFGEVSRVAGALGAEMLEYEDRDFRTTASVMGAAFRASFDTVGVIAGIAGPDSIADRYITEDLPFGLVPIAELGGRLGVETPLVRSLVDIGSGVCDRDFWRRGRGLDRLGLDEMAPDEIRAYVDRGMAAAA